MSKKNKKIEKKVEKTEHEVKPAELSDKDLEQVSGGLTTSTGSIGGESQDKTHKDI